MSGRPSARPKQSWSGVPAELLTYQALKQEAVRLRVSPVGKKTDVMRRVVAARQAAGEQDLSMTDARLAELQQRSRNSRGISASAASPAQASNQGSLRPRTSRAQPGTPQVGSSVPAEDSPQPPSDDSDIQDEEEDTTEEEETDNDSDIEPESDEEELADDHKLDREAVRPTTRRPSPRRRPAARSQQQQQGAAPKQAALRRRASQAKQTVKQTVKQTAQVAQRFARKFPWEWLLAALTLAALLGLGALAWRHLPHHVGGLPHRLHAGVSNLWHGPSDATAATWDKLRHMVKVEGPGSVQCSRQMDHGVLDRLLPVGKLWDGAKVALKDVWSGHKDDATKAAGVLLVADSEKSAAAAAKAVRSAGEAKCGRAILYLDMADWQRDLQRYPAGELAGRLQKQLATQMGRSAHSVIVIQGVHIAPLPLLGVLINALAEGGHFEQGGRQIATSDALFVATMWASPGTVSQASEKEFSSSAKDYLVDSLRQQAVDSETVTRHAMALRRRFEYVMPVQA